MAPNQDTDNLPFELTETDRQNLAQGDEKFKPHTWDEVKEIVGTSRLHPKPLLKLLRINVVRNDLSILKRNPSDLIRYIHWTRDTINTYGSMTKFILKKRLYWQPLPQSTPDTGPIFDTESDIPFASSRDFSILYNDWPYGISPDITHLVVWLKTRIPVEGSEGHLTAMSRDFIDAFVNRTFVERMKEGGIEGDNVMWFRNWVSLQSVRGVEHVHVLVRNVPKEMMDEWTTRS